MQCRLAPAVSIGLGQNADCCSAHCMLGLELQGLDLGSHLWEGSEMLGAVSARHAGQSIGLLLVKGQIGVSEGGALACHCVCWCLSIALYWVSQGKPSACCCAC